MTTKQFAILTLVGGILGVAGSLLPWATITTGFGSVDVLGINADGRFSLVLGAALAVIGFVRYGGQEPGWVRGLGTTLGLLLLALGAFEYSNLSDRIGESSSRAVQAGVGVGLYLVILGGALGLIGGMKGTSEAPAP